MNQPKSELLSDEYLNAAYEAASLFEAFYEWNSESFLWTFKVSSEDKDFYNMYDGYFFE